MYDPKLDGFLGLVVSEVAKFTNARGIGSDYRNELFAAGSLALAEYCDSNRGVHWLTKSASYVRLAIRDAITDHWQCDRQLAVPPSTRRDYENRGETSPEPKRHSLDSVFNDEGVNSHVWRKNARHEWRVPESNEVDWSAAIESLEVVYSLCQDDLDRAIVDARLDGIDSIGDDPVHEADVAEQLGLSIYEVTFRLNVLEARACKALGRRVSHKNRKQRPRRKHSA